MFLRYSLLTTVSAACVAIGSVSSIAADAISTPIAPAVAPPAPANNWTGLYLGGTLGWGQVDTEGVFDNADSPAEQILGSAFNLEGVTGGVHVGYNYQFNNQFVVGIEGDWSYTDWSETLNDPDGGADQATYEVDWIASVRGRLGVSFNNDTSLIYGTAGVAWQDASYEVCDFGICSGVNTGTVDFNDMGFVVGAGLETMITNNFSLRVEGLYYNWDDTIDTSNLATDSDNGDFAEISNSYQVRIGASFHF